ncbi:hypothetical protein [Methylobacterium oxalidis]|uniref:Uncharacterized protein n=2 Tax=Methylobacterium oxalidis TaxID=944322 RepID=A0A512J7M3_9HYPH|nr:hypothetical protein [Methylobacterium oxalidis]GEP05933.1 hypothetical protein MOX02_39710 [Methylobacterium oxalidis]GJE33946.1 hypothetical protein LDDCCGHA_4150 [Methylobacterium oxalidis]
MTAQSPMPRRNPLLRLVASGRRGRVPAASLVPVGRAEAEPRPEPGASRGLTRRHKLMLLLAFETLVFGFAQAERNPMRRGIVIEISVTPNHVVT